MRKRIMYPVSVSLIWLIMACNFGQAISPENEVSPGLDEPTLAITVSTENNPHTEMEPPTNSNPSSSALMPENLVYLGAFRLPETSGGSNWDYSGQGLTYYPSGDATGSLDNFPGSLFGFGHDQQMQVSEISIPVPVNSRNLEDLNTAETLQPFSDITGGKFNFADMDLPVADLEYLSPVDGKGDGKLAYGFGHHIQFFEPSHGFINLDLSNPQTSGPWVFDSFTNYVAGDILFEIPANWSNEHVSGQRLATSRFREGVWGGLGPTLFSLNLGDGDNPASQGATLTDLTPLLLYGTQEPEMPEIITDESHHMTGNLLADHWTGGAWLTSGDKSAVIFVGTKAQGKSWYGFANGVLWDYACAENDPPTCPEVPEYPYEARGFWADGYQAQIIFYDPVDFAKVAAGVMETWEPQPYATLVIDPTLYNPKISLEDSKRELVMAAAYDREHEYLFVVERLGDGPKSIIHVWKVNS